MSTADDMCILALSCGRCSIRHPTMTPEQQSLVDAISAVLQGDPRIEAAWLAGSLGRNAGDEFSDVDVVVLCPDGTANEIAAKPGLLNFAKPVLINTGFAKLSSPGLAAISFAVPSGQRTTTSTSLNSSPAFRPRLPASHAASIRGSPCSTAEIASTKLCCSGVIVGCRIEQRPQERAKIHMSSAVDIFGESSHVVIYG